MKKFLKLLIALVVIVFISLFLIMKWVFWASSNIKKDSFAYSLKVPEDVKNFPVWAGKIHLCMMSI